MNTTNAETSLDDLMVAMDVVDTLRHNQIMVDRELDAEGRRQRLIERLRVIYAEQGIDVTDEVLAEGVAALEQDRFSYTPPRDSLAVKLARIYTQRDRWGKPLLGVMLFALVSLGGYHFGVSKPKADRLAAIPATIERRFNQISALSKDSLAVSRAAELRLSAETAMENKDYDRATQLQLEMSSLYSELERTYSIRVISRPNENSGIFRVPEVNESASNYYLIVEAIDERGRALALPISDEEDGQLHVVKRWGVRVDQRTFNRVADDKRDDGIIQNNIIGIKNRGQIDINYSVPTTGATITAW